MSPFQASLVRNDLRQGPCNLLDTLELGMHTQCANTVYRYGTSKALTLAVHPAETQ